VLQYQLDLVQEECRTMKKENIRLQELVDDKRATVNSLMSSLSRERAAKESLGRQLEVTKSNMGRQLEATQSSLTTSRSQLEHAEAEKNEFRRKWKQSAKELGQLTRTSQSASQVTDSDLDKWASQLRTAIRDFAIRYFESDCSFPDFQERFERAKSAVGFEFMRETTAGTTDFIGFLVSPTRRSAVIQAFIWAFLDQAVFCEFRWAGELSYNVFRVHIKLRDGK
jgi:chromosome segregation ATPase